MSSSGGENDQGDKSGTIAATTETKSEEELAAIQAAREERK